MDDGSTDNTDALINKYINKDARFQYHHRPKDRLPGGNAARNYGFELSKGEYIQWFDSDDLMVPEKIEQQILKLIKSDYNFCVCQSKVFVNDYNSKILSTPKSIVSDRPFEDFVMTKIKWMTPSALWKKSFLIKWDLLFDEELKAAQEWEFQSRMLSKEPNYIALTKTLVYIRKHTNSISYKENSSQRLLHYFLARLKIYENKKIMINEETKRYLRVFLLKHFRKLIPISTFTTNLKLYKLFILQDNKLSVKVKFIALLSILSYFIFNRGEKLLKKIPEKV